MTDPGPQPRSHRKRLMNLLVAVILLVVVVVVAFLMPRYRSYIFTVDGANRWSNETAPPRREVVWQPATPVIPEAGTERISHSHIRPQITDNGNTLYFTVRSAENDLDIVRCQRTSGGWSTPRKVSVLNSDAKDVGPVIRADGQVLYLYSNRAGGFGGMDLYVSRREGDLWGEPVNLGPLINSPAHEYDPAISPDSLRLFFSSNRSEQMHQQLVAGGYDPNRDHWSTTLRNDLGSRTFDLYAADLDPESKRWNQAAPLRWLNTRDHNEGAPFVSPDGAFLVFASDRPTRPLAAKNSATNNNAAKNFDLYRARIDRPGVMPENLGPGVNTSANEIEPCLTSAGFQLLFSRSDPNSVSRYTLYQSTSKEIYRDRQWDRSNAQAFANWVRKLFDHLWLLLLTLAAIALLAWFLRQLTLRRVAIPGFLVAALLLHLFLVTSSFYVFFQQQIAERLKKMFEEPVVATQILLDSAAPTTAEQSTLENVVELAMPQPIQAIEVSRQSVKVPNDLRPIEFAKPQQIANNVSLNADLPSDPVVATFVIEDQPKDVSEVLQRTPAPRPRQAERVHLEQTIAVEVRQVESLPSKKTELDRVELSPPDDLVGRITPEDVEREPLPSVPDISALENSDLQPTETMAASESSAMTPALQRAPPTEPRLDHTDFDTPVPTETVSAVDIQEIPSPLPQSVQLERSNEMLAPAVDQPEPIKLARQNKSAPKLGDSEPLTPVVAETEPAGSVASQPTTSPLKRSRLFSTTINHDSPVSTAAIGLLSKDPPPAPEKPRAKADVARKHPEQPSIEINTLAINGQRETMAAPTVSGEGQDVNSLLAKTDPLSDRPDPVASPLLPRQGSKQSRVYADASVNLQSLLMRRKLDEATKAEVVKEYGGNDQTLVAIRSGLSWIQQHQETDGHWGLHNFNKQCKDHKRCTGHGNSNSDTAGTALALLPFLGDGNTHKDGPYKDVVARGITWLVKNQKPDGNLFTGGAGNAMMYSQGIAAIALCECYGMTGDESLRDPAQRAIDFIVAAQDPKSGGWRYQPRQAGDTSVVGWQVMALKSAQMADLNVPQKSLDESQRWLDSVAGKKNRVGQFAYQGGRFNPAMTAEAILCLEYLGNERDSDYLVHGSDFLLKNLPKKGRETSYYWYYGTQSMFHFQGEHWQRWNEAIHPLLIETQHNDGPMLGTWDPTDQWEKGGGRIYATSLRILMLEVYYRHLPLYQVIR